jgi:hypothetical protein
VKMSDQPKSLNESIYVVQGYRNVFDSYCGETVWKKGDDNGDEFAERMFFPLDYAGNLEHAWKLVKEMEKEGHCVTIRTPSTEGELYTVQTHWGWNSGETVEVAICHAYLRFVNHRHEIEA